MGNKIETSSKNIKPRINLKHNIATASAKHGYSCMQVVA